MPIYEYYCPKCASKFEELRPIARANDAAVCGKGHRGATRTLSVFAMAKGGDGQSLPAMSDGGGCACGGGGCGCGH